MPHDRNGKILEVGDIVNIPCKIKQIHLAEDYCNYDLEYLYPFIDGQRQLTSFVNTKQLEKSPGKRVK